MQFFKGFVAQSLFSNFDSNQTEKEDWQYFFVFRRNTYIVL